MDNYYIIHGLNDIRDAVFGDVRQSLSDLKKNGWTLGVVTGNTRRVTEHKNRAAGLQKLFDPQYIFTGERFGKRSSELWAAYKKQLQDGGGTKIIYVADTIRDLQATIEMKEAMINKGVRGDVICMIRTNSSNEGILHSGNMGSVRLVCFQTMEDEGFRSVFEEERSGRERFRF